MAHTYEDLTKKTVAQLREMAKTLPHEAVQGYTQMNKDHLLPAICTALGIDAHEHHAATGEVKMAAKARMREIKQACERALADGDHTTLHALRREYHHLNHTLRVSARRATLQ